MSRIRILPEVVANKIAAGEVVERPASVVKELLENAIDAGAKSIRIEVESGGKRMIRVTDDGCGMNHDDALLAFERHATSKLRTAEDLLAISTLGFRGEALPSIAAVSRLLLETCAADPETRPGIEQEGRKPEAGSPTSDLQPPTSDFSGTRVEFAGGKLISVKPAGVPVGSTVSVADIFYCVPARRKFLKSETTELGHIASLVTHYALAHPDKQFTLATPSQTIVDAAPVEKLADRVYQLFGRQSLDELLEIPAAAGPFRASITEPEIEADEQAAELRVSGFVSRPEVQRANRNGIYIFVNRRLVRDRLILHAIHDAYRNMMPANVFPAVLLFLEMPHIEVDVNVHPSKIEVRFRHPSFVHDFTRDTMRLALTKARPIAAFPTAGAGAALRSLEATSGQAEAATHNAGAAMTGVAGGQAAGTAPARAVIPAVPLEAGSGFELMSDPLQPEAQRFAFGTDAASDVCPPFSAPDAEKSGAPAPRSLAAIGAQHGAVQAPTSEASYSATPESIATLKPIGQVSNSFIIAVNGEGLWIIDQHVAHERVLFEQHLAARRAGAVTGQRMLAPHIMELAPRQVVIFEQIADELRANGFDVEPMGPRSVAIQAAPAGVATADAEKLLAQILDAVEKDDEAVSMDKLQAKIAASTSCQAAIKVNFPLDQTKMEWLLGELAKTECPMSCPHGRPIVLRYSLKDIEKAFKRI